jgi:alkanesulfonate monooxygenase SsuD/methylene tetrahydromethanopterin reductase-like flavin-dependent oxidoreductase (luciferase family)
VLQLYRDLADGEVSINPSVYVGDWDDVAEHFLYQYNRYREWGGEPQLDGAEDLPRERYIVGTPDEVAVGIRAIHDRTHCDRLFFWARPPGLDIELSNRSLERFAKEVIPRVAAAART